MKKKKKTNQFILFRIIYYYINIGLLSYWTNGNTFPTTENYQRFDIINPC